MPEPIGEFGNLLSQGLRSIAAREDKGMIALQDELGLEIHASRSAIEKWRQGNVPPDPQTVVFLARACAQRGGMDSHWLRRFLIQARFPDSEALVQKLFPDNDGEPALKVRHNLPRRPYKRFTGRKQELAELKRFLSSRHRVGVVCLSGPAGVGKSALALEIAHYFREGYAALVPDERFETIVWVTAKQVELLPAGLTARRPTFTGLDGLCRALAEVLDLPAITRATTREEQDIIVGRTLAEQRILLVLDNLEDVDDQALMVFLRDLPAPSKAIVTTRHRIDVAAPVHLHALNETEARELIRAEHKRHSLTLADEEVEKLLCRTGGLPLAIVRTISRMAWRGSSIEFELRQLGDPTSDLYEFCFEKSISCIRGKDAHRLFTALSLFAIDASREALGHVAGFGKDVLSRDEGLSDLEVLSLATKDSNRFRLDPLTKIRAQNELAMHTDFEKDSQERWVEWYRMLAMQARSTENHSDLQLEVENLLSLMEWLVERERMPEVGWFFEQVHEFLYAEGQWEPLLRVAEQAIAWAETDCAPQILAAALHSSLNVFRNQGAYKQAEEWIERVQVSATRLGNQHLQAEVWLAHGRLLHKQDRFSESARYCAAALNMFRQYGNREKILQSLNTLGNLCLRQGQFEEASDLYHQGIKVLEDSADELRQASQWRVTLQGNLALVAGRQGNYAEACDILYKILDDFTLQTDFAEVYTVLASYELQMGHKDQAYLLQRRADRIIERLGLRRPICPEDDEWIQLHEREN